MPTCPTGASVKVPYNPDYRIWVDRQLWEQATGTPSSWLDFLLPSYGAEQMTVIELCAFNLDDPPFPSLSTIYQAWKRDPFAARDLGNYVRDKLRYQAFTTYCQCNAASFTGQCHSPAEGNLGASLLSTSFAFELGCEFYMPGGGYISEGWGYFVPYTGGVTWTLYTMPDRVQRAQWTNVAISGQDSGGFRRYTLNPTFQLVANQHYLLS